MPKTYHLVCLLPPFCTLGDHGTIQGYLGALEKRSWGPGFVFFSISSASVCRSCDLLPLRFVVFDQAVCSSLVPRLQRFIPFSWSWVARGSASSEVLLGNAARCTPRTWGSQLRTHRTVALCARSRRTGAKRTASARGKPQVAARRGRMSSVLQQETLQRQQQRLPQVVALAKQLLLFRDLAPGRLPG